MSDSVRERVERGARLLDERMPGWADEIDLNRLNMRSFTDCIFGQLYGDLLTGLNLTGLETCSVVSHGFAAPRPREDPVLTTAWANLIRERTGTVAS